MIPTPWILCTLALILHLPPRSIAFPTELAPRDSTPSLAEVLAKDCPHHILSPAGNSADGQCKAVPWDSVESIVSLQNTDHAHLVVVIETSMGLVLCFVPLRDLDQMWLKESKSMDDSKYLTLFTDRLLGTDGQLMKRMNQLLSRQTEGFGTECLPPFDVFHIQIAAPGTKRGVHHPPLVRRMIVDLKAKFKAKFGRRSQPNWAIPVYPFDIKASGNIVIWKFFDVPSGADDFGPYEVAKLWIENAYGAGGNPVAEIELGFPTGYPDPSNPRWMTYVEGTIKYLLEGKILTAERPRLPIPPKPIPQLHDESSNHELSIQNAKESKWITYDDLISDIRCDAVPWSDDGSGSLLGSTNKGMSPLFMMQTTAKFIMCYIPMSQWNDLHKQWKSYQTWKSEQTPSATLGGSDDYDRLRHQFVQSLQDALEKVGSNPVFYGGQFWADYYSSNIHFKSFVKEVLTDVNTVLQAAGRDSASSTIKPYLTTRSNANRDKAPEYWENAMWLPPSAMQGTKKEVWIWKMTREAAPENHVTPPAGVVKGKSEVSILDLSSGKYIEIIPETELE